jgi:hypothetical protein
MFSQTFSVVPNWALLSEFDVQFGKYIGQKTTFPFPFPSEDIFPPPRIRRDVLITHLFCFIFALFCIYFTLSPSISPLSSVFPLFYSTFSSFFLPPLILFPQRHRLIFPSTPGGGGGSSNIYVHPCNLVKRPLGMLYIVFPLTGAKDESSHMHIITICNVILCLLVTRQFWSWAWWS